MCFASFFSSTKLSNEFTFALWYDMVWYGFDFHFERVIDNFCYKFLRMPTCCVPGCKSGYAYLPTPPGVTYHKFPKDTNRCDKWIRCIHRDFTQNESHRVCSLHFRDSDFKLASTDSNTRRKRTTPLQRRYLKPVAYPSVFPNQPSYLSSNPPSERC